MDSDPEQARTLDVQCPVSRLLQLKLGAQVSGKQGLDPGSVSLPTLYPSAQAAAQPGGPAVTTANSLPPVPTHLPVFSFPLPSCFYSELQAALLWISPLPLLELGFLISKSEREISTPHSCLL